MIILLFVIRRLHIGQATRIIDIVSAWAASIHLQICNQFPIAMKSIWFVARNQIKLFIQPTKPKLINQMEVINVEM